MQIQPFHETHSFLSLLGSCQAEFSESELLGKLHQALNSDGYAVQSFQSSPHRFLRGLAEESSGGGVDILSVMMVIVCIVCAGFASGLTQV